jgi:hypothetical protein
MHSQPLELTYEVELAPGEKLTLPPVLVDSVGPGRWIITVQSLPPGAPVRGHTAFLRSYEPEDEGLYDDRPAR